MPLEKFHNQKTLGGFTLIEILTIVSVTAILSALLISYTRKGENQLRLVKDKARFIGALVRSRSLTLATFQAKDGMNGLQTCGYGVRVVDDHTYYMWRDSGADPNCADANRLYDGAAEDFEKPISLLPGLLFKNFNAPDFMQSVLFIPPNPTVITIPAVPTPELLMVTLQTSDGGSEISIGINGFGQVDPGVGF